MRLVLDVDDAPPVLAPSDGLAVDDHVALRADDGERHHVLRDVRVSRRREGSLSCRQGQGGEEGRTRMAPLSCLSSSSFSSVSNG